MSGVALALQRCCALLCPLRSAATSAAAGNWLPGQQGSAQLLNVALHAQSRYAMHGFVAGSEVTTAGMAAALKLSPEVANVQVFAPFAYDGLVETRCVPW